MSILLHWDLERTILMSLILRVRMQHYNNVEMFTNGFNNYFITGGLFLKELLWLSVKCLQIVFDVNYYVYYCESCAKCLKRYVFITLFVI